jgi:L-asparagine transporter-like permease
MSIDARFADAKLMSILSSFDSEVFVSELEIETAVACATQNRTRQKKVHHKKKTPVMGVFLMGGKLLIVRIFAIVLPARVYQDG